MGGALGERRMPSKRICSASVAKRALTEVIALFLERKIKQGKSSTIPLVTPAPPSLTECRCREINWRFARYTHGQLDNLTIRESWISTVSKFSNRKSGRLAPWFDDAHLEKYSTAWSLRIAIRQECIIPERPTSLLCGNVIYEARHRVGLRSASTPASETSYPTEWVSVLLDPSRRHTIVILLSCGPPNGPGTE